MSTINHHYWTVIPRRRGSYITWHDTEEEARQEAVSLLKSFGILCDVREEYYA